MLYLHYAPLLELFDRVFGVGYMSSLFPVLDLSSHYWEWKKAFLKNISTRRNESPLNRRRMNGGLHGDAEDDDDYENPLDYDYQ
jgi:hypothetical protein